MLTPDSRVVLLEQLRAPEGYTFDAGVATTFTLDLTAALIPPLAFAGAAIRNQPDPISVLAAVRGCTDRLDIFCQVGQVAMPSAPSPLFTYLEQMVHPVAPPNGHLFHPKVWFLRYACPDEEPEYRLLVLSRNLTNDHSWDISLRLDGRLDRQTPRKTEPLSAFLRSLPGRAVARPATERQQRVEQLADEASRLAWDFPESVTEVAFHPYGVPGLRPQPDFSGYRHLVISPFADEDGLDLVTDEDASATIISRGETLDRLPSTWLKGRGPFHVVDTMGAQVEDDAPILLDGLHAKAYVVERQNRAHVFLGSANASTNAFRGNVEFVIELVAGHTKLGVDRFLHEEDGLGSLLIPYEPIGDLAVPESELEQKRLENLLRTLAAKRWVVTVQGSAEPYALSITADELTVPEDVQASVELLTRKGELHTFRSGSPTASFGEVPRVDITPFLGLRLRGKQGVEVSGVVLASLINDPEDRLDEVLAQQIDTPEKFLRFLALLLNVGGQRLLQMLAGLGTGDGTPAALGPAPGVFEVVLRALARAPKSVADLDGLVQQMLQTDQGRAALPEGFAQLWEVVRTAHLQIGGAR